MWNPFKPKPPTKASQRFDNTAEGTPSGYPAEQPAYQPVPEEGVSPGSSMYFAGRENGLDGLHGRVPRLFYPNLGMLAGLTSVDGTRQTEHTAFLPPMEPMQRGGQIRAVSGGKNRVSGSGQQGSSYVPGVYVPVGRR